MYGDPTTTPGGKSLKFYASVRVQISRVSSLDVKDKNENLVQRGIRARVVKNKTGLPFKKAEFQVYLDGREANKDLTDDIANIALNMGLIVRCDKDGNPKATGRRYLLEYTVPETGEIEIVDVNKKDLVSEALKDCPNMQKYLLGIIRGEIERPDNGNIPEEEDFDSDMSDEDFEEMMKEENYGENTDDEAEEIESLNWEDM